MMGISFFTGLMVGGIVGLVVAALLAARRD